MIYRYTPMPPWPHPLAVAVAVIVVVVAVAVAVAVVVAAAVGSYKIYTHRPARKKVQRPLGITMGNAAIANFQIRRFLHRR